VIRQVITCDICGTQKRETNHWFVAYEESGELRISGWNSLHLLSPETKHLCGETCAHKLISHFLMRLVDGGMQRSTDKGDTGGGASPATEVIVISTTFAREHSLHDATAFWPERGLGDV
jgi:hypothetical protein